jgi:hypothetical protein
VLYKFTAVRSIDALIDAGNKTGLIFEHAVDSVLHQLLDVFTVGKGHLLETRFSLRREMYFHAFKVRGLQREVEGAGAASIAVVQDDADAAGAFDQFDLAAKEETFGQ